MQNRKFICGGLVDIFGIEIMQEIDAERFNR